MKKNVVTLLTVVSALICGSTSLAKSLEDGSSFRGTYRVLGEAQECGSRNAENTVAGLVEIAASIHGIRIQSVVQNYAQPSGHFDIFRLDVAKNPTSVLSKDAFIYKNGNYLSEKLFHSTLIVKLDANDIAKTVATRLELDSDDLLTLQEVYSFSPKVLNCRYQRVN